MNAKQLIISDNELFIDTKAESYLMAEPYLYQESIKKVIGDRYDIIRYPFKDASEYRTANEYIVSLTRRVIRACMPSFNEKHGIDFNERQWTIVLCIWLKGVLFDLYYKYKKLETIDRSQVFVVGSSKYGMENRIASYIKNGIVSTEKNTFIWTVVCEKLGIKTVKKDYQTKKINLVKGKEFFLKGLRNPQWVFEFLNRKNSHYVVSDQIKNNAEVILFDTLLPPDVENKIISESDGRIGKVKTQQLHYWSNRIIKKYDRSEEYRNNILNNTFVPESEYEKIAWDFIKRYIPLPYVEAFDELYEGAYNITKQWDHIRKTYSVCACVELIDICNAIQSGKGTQICEIQHSAGYAIYDTYLLEESMYADIFLTWGWRRPQFKYVQAQMKPVVITRFPNKIASLPKSNSIILACNYVMKSEAGHGWYFGNYIDKQMEFIDHLEEKIRKRIVLRIDSKDSANMEFVYRCRQRYPYIKIEDRYEISFSKSIDNCVFVVCDYFSSTHVEAMLMGRPFIMFNASEVVAYNPFIVPLLEELKVNDIYRDTGKELAELMNGQKDIDQWLYDKSKKIAYRRYFKKCIGIDKCISEGAIEEIRKKWQEEFLNE